MRHTLLVCFLFAAVTGCGVDTTPQADPIDDVPNTPPIEVDETPDAPPTPTPADMPPDLEPGAEDEDMSPPPPNEDEDMTPPPEDEDMPEVDPCTIDSDGDTLSDCVEARLGTDPFNPDTDYDGLSDGDELQLGTDPLVIDSDGDGLGDYVEFQASTDPLGTDTDGDGVEDGEEAQYGFDPLRADSFGDGVIDGDRFLVHACDNPATEPVDYYRSNNGDWLLALQAAFNNYLELTPVGSVPQVTSAVFDDPANEISGFVLSTPRSGTSDPIAVRNSYNARIRTVGTILDQFDPASFETHDFHTAAPGRYEISTTGKSSRQVRDELLFGIAPFGPADITGSPNASGNVYGDYVIRMTVIMRQDRVLTLLAVAPKQLWETREAVDHRMSDLTNTTGIASASAETLQRCYPFPATTEIPKADFYWVLDQSGSMDIHYDKVRRFATDFTNRLAGTSLDYRLGVTNMEESFSGKLRTNPGWHTDPNTFSNEIQYYVIDCTDNFSGCSGSEENGLYAAREGITYMRRSNTPQSMQIRSDANLATIFMSDEEDQSIKDGRDPGGPSVGAARLLNDYKAFFARTPLAFSIVGTGNGCGTNGGGYREVALASGGADASLCSQDLLATIDTISEAVAGNSSPFRLQQTPISSTLRVFQAADDGKTGVWVPRSRVNGFDYFPASNSIAFFGSYRPVVGANQPMQVAVHYETFQNRIKTQP